jgi:AcrR family transcriptional regulator
MNENRIASRKGKFGSRGQPVQARSRQRHEEILQTTGRLLEQVGFDDLTTILIARELGISVGALYHYFPNKQAILYAMGERWLQEYTTALDDTCARPLEELSLEGFVAALLNRLLRVYHEQKGLLPLIQAMYSVPELRDLDETHDTLVIERLSQLLRRMGFEQRKSELNRIGRLWLEMTHALMLSIAEQKPAKARASTADLHWVAYQLLEKHRSVASQ